MSLRWVRGGTMSFEETIKQYLDNLSKTDEYFGNRYDSSKIKGCVKYIYEEVKKKVEEKKGTQCVATSDDEVYQLAVHYFLEQLWEKETAEEEQHDQEPVEIEVKQSKPKTKEEPKNDNVFDIFDFIGEE